MRRIYKGSQIFKVLFDNRDRFKGQKNISYTLWKEECLKCLSQ